jgi:Leucine-rich repeat (LRR) protein
MKIRIEENQEYDTGYHPDITEIMFRRRVVGDFFKDDRFPNLISLICSQNQLTELKLNCSSLQNLDCSRNNLTKLELNCPSLQILNCSRNNLTKLKLNCPSLQNLYCSYDKLINLELNCPSLRKLFCDENKLTNLNGLEFCDKLTVLLCSSDLEESVKFLKCFIPGLEVQYDKD